MTAKLSGAASEVNLTCALCGAALNPESKRCTRCGSTADRVGRCAQCQAVASIEPNKSLVWACSVCGSARLVNSSCEAQPEIQQSLHAATRAHRLSKVATPLSIVTTVVGVVALLFALLLKSVFSASDSTTAWLVSLPVLILFLSALGYAWSSKLRKSRGARLDDAYRQALLRQLSANTSGSTSSELAKVLGVEPKLTERLLAQLNVRDDVTAEVTEEGQIAYSMRSLQGPMTQPLTERLRVPNEAPLQEDANALTDELSREVKTQISSINKT